MRNKEELKSLQSLPLHQKVALTQARIEEWVDEFGEEGVYIAWSGGLNSTVLRHIVLQMYPGIESVFSNTGLEFPEIQKFVFAAQRRGENVTVVRPKMRFDQVIKKYGYPIISKDVSEKIRKGRKNIRDGNYSLRLCQLGVKRGEYGTVDRGEYDYDGAVEGSKFSCKKYRPLLDVDFLISDECCGIMKKEPMQKFEEKTGKRPILGQLTEESMKRETAWIKTGCNAFDAKKPQSNPIAFWTSQDCLEYVKKYNLEIPSVYGDVVYAEDPEQIRWGDTVPEMTDLDGDEQRKLTTTGCKRTGCIFCAFGAHCNDDTRFVDLKRTHPRLYEYCIGGGEYNDEGVWQPSKEGLGMGHVFEKLNRLYGEGFIKYYAEEFERQYPEIATNYFDMKWSDFNEQGNDFTK